MRKIFVILLVATIFTATATFAIANDDSPAASINTPRVSWSPTGTYIGDVDANNGYGAFELVLEPQEGKTVKGNLQFYKANRKCRGQVPIFGTIRETDVEIQAPGFRSDCGRTLILSRQQNADGTINGVLSGPRGTFNVKLRK